MQLIPVVLPDVPLNLPSDKYVEQISTVVTRFKYTYLARTSPGVLLRLMLYLISLSILKSILIDKEANVIIDFYISILSKFIVHTIVSEKSVLSVTVISLTVNEVR